MTMPDNFIYREGRSIDTWMTDGTKVKVDFNTSSTDMPSNKYLIETLYHVIQDALDNYERETQEDARNEV